MKENGKISFWPKIILFVGLTIVFNILIKYMIIPFVPNILVEIIPFRQFSPTLAYLVFISAFRNMFVPIIIKPNKNIIKNIILAIIVPIFIFGIGAFSVSLVYKINGIIRNPLNLSFVLIINIVIGSICEEIGWRSFLLTTLEKKYNVLVSSIIVGVIWAFWHTGRFAMGIYYVGTLLIITILFTIIMAAILKDTKNNIIVATLLHSFFNISNEVFMVDLIFIIICLFLTAIIYIMIEREYFINTK